MEEKDYSEHATWAGVLKDPFTVQTRKARRSLLAVSFLSIAVTRDWPKPRGLPMVEFQLSPGQESFLLWLVAGADVYFLVYFAFCGFSQLRMMWESYRVLIPSSSSYYREFEHLKTLFTRGKRLSHCSQAEALPQEQVDVMNRLKDSEPFDRLSLDSLVTARQIFADNPTEEAWSKLISEICIGQRKAQQACTNVRRAWAHLWSRAGVDSLFPILAGGYALWSILTARYFPAPPPSDLTGLPFM